MSKRIARAALLALVLAALAACGQASPGSGGAAPIEGAALPTAAPTVAAAASPVEGAASATALPQATSGPLAGIEQGTTPEGYHTLGSASAPVTLAMYSDFL